MARPVARNVDENSIIQVMQGDQEPPIYGDDADTENAWGQWAEDLKTSQAKGQIRVARVPTNDDGTPNTTKKGQAQLFSFAHDQYSYDEVLEKIRRGFMKPGETICVRLTGIRTSASGHSGVVPFNRIVTVTREMEEARGESSQLGEVLKEFRQMSEAQQSLLQSALQKSEPVAVTIKPASETIKEWLGILGPIMSPIVLALVTRPKQANELGQLIDAMSKLQGLKGGGDSAESEDNSTMGIIKAVAPEGLRLLTTLAQNQKPPLQHAPQRPPVSSNIISGTPVPPQRIEPPVAPSAPVTQPAEDSTVLAQLKPALLELVSLAEQNADPADVAKLTLQLIPENQDDNLYALVESPTAFARLKLLVPGIGAHTEWFERLRVAMLAEYEGEAEEPVAPATN